MADVNLTPQREVEILEDIAEGKIGNSTVARIQALRRLREIRDEQEAEQSQFSDLDGGPVRRNFRVKHVSKPEVKSASR